MVGGGLWIVDSRFEKLSKKGEGDGESKLREPQGLSASSQVRGADIRSNPKISERRTVRPDQPDQKGSRLDPAEYSRRPRQRKKAFPYCFLPCRAMNWRASFMKWGLARRKSETI